MGHSFADVIEVLLEAERSLPVNDWRVMGVQVWPMIRVRLYFTGLKHEFDTSKATSHRPRLPKAAGKLAEMALGALGMARASLLDRRAEAPAGGTAQVVFLSDGISFARFEGKWFERFCDPLIDHLTAAGVTSRMLVPSHNYLAPRHSRSRWIQPQLDQFQLAGMLTRVTPDLVHLDRYDEFLRLLSGRNYAIDELAQGHIIVGARRVAAISDYFRKQLTRLSPRLAFLVNYYAVEGYGFVRACRELGIPCVDLQHGVQGDLHPAYGSFSAMPPQGYDLLPDYFWVWSSMEEEAMTRWNGRCPARHRPIVGGNPWLQTWLSGDSPVVARYDELLAESFAKIGVRQQALVTLQPGLGFESFLDPLMEVMRAAGPAWHWWIRLHPGMRDVGAEVVRRLRDGAPGSFEVEQASALPLYALLRRVDLHVTYSSSVVLEAASFGVPSLVCSDTGAALFAEVIESGLARRFRFDAPGSIETLASFSRATQTTQESQGFTTTSALARLCRSVGAIANPVT